MTLTPPSSCLKQVLPRHPDREVGVAGPAEVAGGDAEAEPVLGLPVASDAGRVLRPELGGRRTA